MFLIFDFRFLFHIFIYETSTDYSTDNYTLLLG